MPTFEEIPKFLCFSRLSVSQLLEGGAAGIPPAHLWSMGIVMARFTDAQRNWGAVGSYSEGYGGPEIQAPAQHFGRKA